MDQASLFYVHEVFMFSWKPKSDVMRAGIGQSEGSECPKSSAQVAVPYNFKQNARAFT